MERLLRFYFTFVRPKTFQMTTPQRQKNNATAIMLLFLLGCTIGGITGCVHFGQMTHRDLIYSTSSGFSSMVTADSGLNGGAIGCGIFAATALYGLVKVFIAKTN
jgi:hypothetical protein